MVCACPSLRRFGIYSSGHHVDRYGHTALPLVPDSFVSQLTRAPCAGQLVAFECYGILIRQAQCLPLLRAMPRLSTLGIQIRQWREDDVLEKATDHLDNLENLHILSPETYEGPEWAEKLVNRLQPPIRQFSVRNRCATVSLPRARVVLICPLIVDGQSLDSGTRA